MGKKPTVGFADLALSRRRIQEHFFRQINLLIDWSPILNIINKRYRKAVLRRIAALQGVPAAEVV